MRLTPIADEDLHIHTFMQRPDSSQSFPTPVCLQIAQSLALSNHQQLMICFHLFLLI